MRGGESGAIQGSFTTFDSNLVLDEKTRSNIALEKFDGLLARLHNKNSDCSIVVTDLLTSLSSCGLGRPNLAKTERIWRGFLISRDAFLDSPTVATVADEARFTTGYWKRVKMCCRSTPTLLKGIDDRLTGVAVKTLSFWFDNLETGTLNRQTCEALVRATRLGLGFINYFPYENCRRQALRSLGRFYTESGQAFVLVGEISRNRQVIEETLGILKKKK